MLTDIWQQVNREFPTESTLKELRTAITYIKIWRWPMRKLKGWKRI